MGNKNWLCVNWEDSFNQKKKKNTLSMWPLCYINKEDIFKKKKKKP